ncbi:TPA: hypothetical protein LY657_002288 [Enterococcus faecium]|nr:hypothetical protein [Enterococcus faecium]
MIARTFKEHRELIEWLRFYCKRNLSDNEKIEIIDDTLQDFDVPEINITELLLTHSTLLPESSQFNILEKYCQAMKLVTSYVKVGSRYQLAIQIPKGYLKEKEI